MYIRELFRDEKELSRIDVLSIVSHVLSLSKERVLMEPERSLDHDEGERIGELIRQRREGKPLAYLTRQREFFSESFYVDERVLIPRPETESLVEEALLFMRDLGRPARVLDMGCGSGIIGILLAKGGAQQAVCADISIDALSVARRNALDLDMEERMIFLTSDLFSSMRRDADFDIICANLPYVGRDEWEALMPDVRCYEPMGALLGGETGLELYVRFAAEAVSHLRSGGALFCEVAGEAQAASVGALLTKAGLAVTVVKDLAGCQRVVRGVWTNLS